MTGKTHKNLHVKLDNANKSREKSKNPLTFHPVFL